jgi:tetratricopeptide (TPR) repeat protein
VTSERIIDAAALAATATGDPFATYRVAEAAAKLGLSDRARQLLAGIQGARDESWWIAFIAAAWARLGDANAVAAARVRLEERWRKDGATPDGVQNDVELLAGAYERLGDEGEADAILGRLSDPGPALTVAMIAADAGRLDRAEALVARVDLDAPEHAETAVIALVDIGKAAARAGDRVRAAKLLDRAVDVARGLDPWELRVSAISSIAIAFGSIGDGKKALKTARLAEKALPRVRTGYGPTWSLTLSDALRAGGDTKRADAILYANDAFHAQGPSPAGYAIAAVALAERDDDGGARKRIEQAEEALAAYAPSDLLAQDAYARLAQAHAILGDLDRALEHAAAVQSPEKRLATLLSLADRYRA